jgi:hypothetical protein
MIMETIWNIINIATAVIAVASAIVAATPGKKDDKALGKIKAVLMPILNALSLKIGHAKNKT